MKKPSGILRPNVYKLLNECVERGTNRGYIRAHKHTDDPSEETIREAIEHYIMLEISECFDFD